MQVQNHQVRFGSTWAIPLSRYKGITATAVQSWVKEANNSGLADPHRSPVGISCQIQPIAGRQSYALIRTYNKFPYLDRDQGPSVDDAPPPTVETLDDFIREKAQKVAPPNFTLRTDITPENFTEGTLHNVFMTPGRPAVFISNPDDIRVADKTAVAFGIDPNDPFANTKAGAVIRKLEQVIAPKHRQHPYWETRVTNEISCAFNLPNTPSDARLQALHAILDETIQNKVSTSTQGLGNILGCHLMLQQEQKTPEKEALTLKHLAGEFERDAATTHLALEWYRLAVDRYRQELETAQSPEEVKELHTQIEYGIRDLLKEVPKQVYTERGYPVPLSSLPQAQRLDIAQDFCALLFNETAPASPTLRLKTVTAILDAQNRFEDDQKRRDNPVTLDRTKILELLKQTPFVRLPAGDITWRWRRKNRPEVDPAVAAEAALLLSGQQQATVPKPVVRTYIYLATDNKLGRHIPSDQPYTLYNNAICAAVNIGDHQLADRIAAEAQQFMDAMEFQQMPPGLRPGLNLRTRIGLLIKTQQFTRRFPNSGDNHCIAARTLRGTLDNTNWQLKGRHTFKVASVLES